MREWGSEGAHVGSNGRAQLADRSAQDRDDLFAQRDPRGDELWGEPVFETILIASARFGRRTACNHEELNVFPSAAATVTFLDVGSDRVGARNLVRAEAGNEGLSGEH